MVRILVVDDDKSVRQGEEIRFKAWQFEVMLAVDGQEAWELLLVTPEFRLPSIIYSDHGMPRMNGEELLHKVRGNPKTAHIAFIMQSGNRDTADRMRPMCEELKAVFRDKPSDVNIEDDIMKAFDLCGQ